MDAPMGFVYTEITLKNTSDVIRAGDGAINEKDIRQVTVQAIVDTGASTLVISEELRKQLGLNVRGRRRVILANETQEIGLITEPVEIHWKERDTTCRALAISGARQILLGAIPLEDMDLLVDPKKQELVGAHGDEILSMAK